MVPRFAQALAAYDRSGSHDGRFTCLTRRNQHNHRQRVICNDLAVLGGRVTVAIETDPASRVGATIITLGATPWTPFHADDSFEIASRICVQQAHGSCPVDSLRHAKTWSYSRALDLRQHGDVASSSESEATISSGACDRQHSGPPRTPQAMKQHQCGGTKRMPSNASVVRFRRPNMSAPGKWLTEFKLLLPQSNVNAEMVPRPGSRGLRIHHSHHSCISLIHRRTTSVPRGSIKCVPSGGIWRSPREVIRVMSSERSGSPGLMRAVPLMRRRFSLGG